MNEGQFNPSEFAAELDLNEALNIGIGVSPPIAVIVEGWGTHINEIRSINRPGADEERLAREAAGNAFSGVVRQETPPWVPDNRAEQRVRIHACRGVKTVGLAFGHLPPAVKAALPDDTVVMSSGEYPAQIAAGLAEFANGFLTMGFMTPMDKDVKQVAKDAERLLLFTDGSFKPDEDTGKSEHSGYGYLIVTPDGMVIDIGAGALEAKNSMIAEAEALQIGLARVADFSTGNVAAHTDAKHLPLSFDKQSYFEDDELNDVMERCHAALYQFDDIQINRIPREYNGAADQLARQGRKSPVRLRDFEEDGKIKQASTKYST